MKTTKFLKSVSLLLILVIAISCRSSRYSTGRQYPANPAPPTESSTNIYVVKDDGGNLPPGQAKKIYGGQSAKAYAPGQRKKYRYPLVIVHTRELVISRYSDGRYYHRNTAGHIYWKGTDGRYYIDEKHLKDVEYEEGDYDDWKFKGTKNNKAQGPKGKDQEETVKEDQKAKDTEHIAKVREQKGMDQNQKANDNDQKGKDRSDQKEKGNDPKRKDEADQKGGAQTDQKEKGNGQNGKDQTDQKEKGNAQKAKDKSDQKEKDGDKKGKDQTDQKAKDDDPQKAKAKSKG
ncbi:MAG TPA: hypothetical protein VJ765_03905 [Chitinophagaceae bacterium]|nr:hypothetical protein [Chitinophagaceae bacterium]